jgi:ABC-2 type transport system permease protein
MSPRVAYLRFELIRTLRNRRVMIFSLAFPIVLYLLIAGPNKHEHSLGGTGISAPLYFMIGLAAFGTMNAMLSSGARIAAERSVGWNRQLRITPLTTRQYFRAKVATSYLLAIVALLALYVAGAALGVSLPADGWVQMTGLILIGLVPFAAMGIWLGHMLTADSVGPAIGGTTAAVRGSRSPAAASWRRSQRSCRPTGSCRQAEPASARSTHGARTAGR